jgi:hypothetical protein
MVGRGTIRVAPLLPLVAFLLISFANAWIPVTHHFKIKCLQLHGDSPTSSSELFFAAASPDDKGDDDTGWEDEPMPMVNKPFQERTISSIPSGSRNEPQRDLFIPIFAIVAIVGLLGSYGYEMMRLASRGELYLPWST